MLAESIKSYIENREQLKLEKHDKETASKLEKLREVEKSEYKANQKTVRNNLKQSFEPANWLADAAKRASQIQLATHAPKFIHGDAKSSSVNASELKGVLGRIGTSSIDNLTLDVTGNAAALDVANLLLLSDGSESLWQKIAKGDLKVLEIFASSNKQLVEWEKGFLTAINGSEFFSHSLGKQIYFPTEDNDYHLLTPLFPTSLCHEIYGLTQRSRFSEEAKLARESRRKKLPSKDDVVNYVGMAEMKFGGSKPQNISLLNSQRRGMAYLLSNAPPNWQSKFQLPVKGKNTFWKTYHRKVFGRLIVLNQFLNKLGQYSNKSIRTAREQMVTGLIEEWLTVVATIRQSGNPGWSVGSDLTIQEQCLLDPRRRDDYEQSAFNEMMDSGEWRKRISEDYGRWLNKKLSNKKRRLTDVEFEMWSAEVSNTLSRLRNDLESFL